MVVNGLCCDLIKATNNKRMQKLMIFTNGHFNSE